jgi:type I restriction enzyme S subunit
MEGRTRHSHQLVSTHQRSLAATCEPWDTSRRMKLIPITELAELNPKAFGIDLNSAGRVSFIPMADVDDSGRWRTQQSRPLCEVSSGFTSFQEGDVLFAKITPCMENGKGAHAVDLVNGLGFGSTEFHVIRAKGGNCSRFLYHWIQSRELRHAAAAQMIGSAGQQRVPTVFFTRFLVPEINPEKQRRIAEILDSADEAITNAEAVIEKLKMIRIGMMRDLFTRGLDKNGKLRPAASEAPQIYNNTKIGLLPKDWSADPLSKNCETYSGGTPARRVSQYYGGGIPWVKSGEVNLDTILSTEESLSEKGLAASNAKWIPAGTPVIAMYGATAGKVSWLAVTATANQAVLAMVPRSENNHARYVLWAMRFAAPRLIALATGSGQPNLSKGIIDSLLLPLPEDPKEQIAIAEALDTVASRIITEQMNLDKLKNLKAGLMNDLLTGKVSVLGTTAQHHDLGQLPFAERGAA